MSAVHYPYGQEFQEKVLGLMVREPTFLPSYHDVIESDFFTDEASATLARIILDHYDERGEIPTSLDLDCSVTDHLSTTKLDSPVKKELMDLMRLVSEVDLSEATTQVKERVAEFGKHRILQSLTVQIGDMLGQGRPTDDIWNLYDKARIMGSSAGSEVKNLSTDLYDAVDIIQSSSLYSVSKKISTGLPSLDKMTGGGIGRRQLMSVMAFTNVGKSMFLVNVGHAAIRQRGVPVLHMSVGEMEWEDMLARYGARITGIDINKITRNPEIASEFKSKLKEVFDRLQPNLFFKYVPPYTSVTKLRAMLSKLRHKDGVEPGLVLVDNADELSSSKNSQEKYEEQGHVYTELRSIAHDFDVAIFADTQTNRFGGEKAVADMSVMGESHRKNKKLDGLFSLNQTHGERMQGVMRVAAIKGRRFNREDSQGGDGTFYCEVDRNTMTLKEIPFNDPRVAAVNQKAAHAQKGQNNSNP